MRLNILGGFCHRRVGGAVLCPRHRSGIKIVAIDKSPSELLHHPGGLSLSALHEGGAGSPSFRPQQSWMATLMPTRVVSSQTLSLLMM